MRFLIISATQRTSQDFKYNSPLGQSLYKYFDKYNNLSWFIEYENKKGLPIVYNKVIEENKDIDIFIFVHDDVYLNDCFILDKLEETLKIHDVVGVAGSSNFSINRQPNCWHNSPKESWSGFVVHPKDNNQNNSFYCTNFGNSPKNVICLDGLILVCKTNIFKNPEVRFDPQFPFHFYDLDFSLTCYKNKFSLSTCPIILTHMSHGTGILSEEYKILNQNFIKKWSKTV